MKKIGYKGAMPRKDDKGSFGNRGQKSAKKSLMAKEKTHSVDEKLNKVAKKFFGAKDKMLNQGKL